MSEMTENAIQVAVFRLALEAGAVYVHCNTSRFYGSKFPWDIVAKFSDDKVAKTFARELKTAYPDMYSHAAYGSVIFRPKMRKVTA